MNKIFLGVCIALLAPSLSAQADQERPPSSAMGACASPNIDNREQLLSSAGWERRDDDALASSVLAQYFFYMMTPATIDPGDASLSGFEAFVENYMQNYGVRVYVHSDIEETLLFGSKNEVNDSGQGEVTISCVIAAVDNIVSSTDAGGHGRNLPAKAEDDFGSHRRAEGFWRVVDRHGRWTQADFTEFNVLEDITFGGNTPPFRGFVHVETDFID